MKTANFPRPAIMNVAGRYLSFPVGEDDWLISICDPDVEDAKVAYPFDKVLFMRFLDTDSVEDGITAQEAEQIAAFIKEARGKKNVYVNCHAGICRSGAIVEILGLLGWDIQDQLMESPGRIPNTLVFDMVRKHFPEIQQSWDTPEDIWGAVKGW